MTALVQARPYPNLATLHAVAQQKSLAWGEPELDLALSAHPRIGENPPPGTDMPRCRGRNRRRSTIGMRRSSGVNGGQRPL